MCKITAPESEPQRGFKFSSQDAKGSIDTSPEGRILSSIESEAYRSRDQRRPSADLASFNVGSPPPDIDMRQVTPKSPPRDMRMEGFSVTPRAGIKEFGPPSKRVIDSIRDRFDNTLDFTDKPNYKRFEPPLPQTPILKLNIFRNIDPDDLRFQDDVEGVDIPMPMQKPDRRSGIKTLDFTDRPDYKRFQPLDFTDRPNYKRFEPASSGVPEFDQDNEGDDPNDIRQKFGEDDITAMAMKAVEDMEASQKQNVNRNVGGFFDRFGLSTRFRRPDMPEFTGGFDKKKMFEAFKNFFRARFNRMGFGEELGENQRPFLNQNATQFANGGIVGLRNGGFNIREFEEERVKRQPTAGNTFTTNLTTRDDKPVKFTGDQFDTSNVDEIRAIEQAKEQQRQERMRDLQTGFESAFNVNVPNDPFKAMQARINDSQYQDFLNAQDSIFAGVGNKIGEILGYKDPFEFYKATQAQKIKSKAAAEMRNKDRDRALAKSMLETQQPFDPCPEGFKYDSAEQKCVPIEEDVENELGQEFVRNPEAFTGDPNMYGRVGGEYQFFTEVPGLIKAANGIPRGPTGEIRGAGGPKDDLVGPFMLSDQEYVLPKEMVMAAGGGNYDTGIKKLENMRKDSLNKYGDYV